MSSIESIESIDSIEKPTHSEDIGIINDISYVRYSGQFRGATNQGEFAVPYEITVPRRPIGRKQFFLFEPPHITSGLIARETVLGRTFVFGSGYVHASVGFGNRAGHILDQTPGFQLKIKGRPVRVLPLNSNPADEVVDLRIIRKFALRLRERASDLFGEAEHILATGFSESGKTIHDVYQEFGHQVFDLTLVGNAPFLAPVKFREQNPIMVVNAERDFDKRARPNPNFPAYHYYDIAGGPHIPDAVTTRKVFPGNGNFPPPIAGTSPLNWLPIVRALVKAGELRVKQGKQLPASATFLLDFNGNIARDEKHNALGGIRHPALALKEAHFIASVDRNGWDLFGGYEDPIKLTERQFPQYLNHFKSVAAQLRDAGYLMPVGYERLIREAQLNPPNTYTLNYRDGLLLKD